MTLLKGKQVATGADGIATTNIADLAVTTAKLGPNAATAAKVGSDVIVAAGTNAFSADQSHGGFKITNLGAPIAASDAARKADVDAASAGLTIKAPVRLATVAALPAYTRLGNVITLTAVGVLSVDSVPTVLNDRILLKNGAAGEDNGLYFVSTEGTAGVAAVLTRTTDADTSAEVVAGIFTFVEAGATLADTGWVLQTNNPIVLNTTALTFVQFSATAPRVDRQESITTQNVSTDTALTDLLDNVPVSNASVALYLNGLLQRQGSGFDYTIASQTITWLAGTGTAVDMSTTDELIALYTSAS